jgi:hypothetical protein
MGGMNAGQGTPVEYANFVNYWEADKNAEEEKKAKERSAAEEKKEKGKAVAVDAQNSKSSYRNREWPKDRVNLHRPDQNESTDRGTAESTGQTVQNEGALGAN